MEIHSNGCCPGVYGGGPKFWFTVRKIITISLLVLKVTLHYPAFSSLWAGLMDSRNDLEVPASKYGHFVCIHV